MNALEVQTVHNYAYVLVSDEEASWTVFCGFSLNCRSYRYCVMLVQFYHNFLYRRVQHKIDTVTFQALFTFHLIGGVLS